MARTFAIVFGAVYALVGVLGFVLPSPILGIFGVNPLHNIAHLGVGGLWLISAFMPIGPLTPRVTSQIIGIVYIVLAVLGFAAASVFNSLLNPGGEGLLADNLLHLFTGALGLYIGFIAPRDTTVTA